MNIEEIMISPVLTNDNWRGKAIALYKIIKRTCSRSPMACVLPCSLGKKPTDISVGFCRFVYSPYKSSTACMTSFATGMAVELPPPPFSTTTTIA